MISKYFKDRHCLQVVVTKYEYISIKMVSGNFPDFIEGNLLIDEINAIAVNHAKSHVPPEVLIDTK